MKKPADNIDSFKSEPSPPFTRYENGLYVPEDHDPDGLIVYQHGINLPIQGHHFASIIAGKPGEYLFENRRASIDVWIDESSVNFANGIFGEYSMKGSMLIPKTPFPALAAKLSMEPWAVDDEEEFVTDEIEAEYPDKERPVFFHILTAELPCETLQLFKHWNYFEAIEACVSERFLALYGHPCGNSGLVEFQEQCELLDLKIGRENPHEEPLKSIDACLDVLGAWHCEQVRRISAKPSEERRQP